MKREPSLAEAMYPGLIKAKEEAKANDHASSRPICARRE
jgi:hypothetical protein